MRAEQWGCVDAACDIASRLLLGVINVWYTCSLVRTNAWNRTNGLVMDRRPQGTVLAKRTHYFVCSKSNSCVYLWCRSNAWRWIRTPELHADVVCTQHHTLASPTKRSRYSSNERNFVRALHYELRDAFSLTVCGVAEILLKVKNAQRI